jgi:hypothetical protein
MKVGRKTGREGGRKEGRKEGEGNIKIKTWNERRKRRLMYMYLRVLDDLLFSNWKVSGNIYAMTKPKHSTFL